MRFSTFLLVYILMMTIFIVADSSAQDSMSQPKHEVIMRTIGHEVLKAHDDTTSRVLPVEGEGDSYVIQFENEFVFQATKLAAAVDQVVKKYNFASEYLVEIEHCVTKEIIHSYQINNTIDLNMIPCGSRTQPKACYNLRFTILDQLQTIVPSASLEDSRLSIKIIWVMSIFLTVGFLIYFYQKRSTVAIDPNMISIGSYQFDTQKMFLANGDINVKLTSKEAELLILLCESVNITISRDDILRQVWGDNGDYIGRTLDVFVSKLRKKLESDPSIKIANIRGVGYRLVV